ncbi:rRNA maturation RNase YbeY [Aeoliella mucimassa]|uniref:Endoribonuclease YbeY n=1 Tax=Aeoliella mucimassa TaxID=2527972 RepID=A0A518ATF4_9BACT|nr:rRNA maturation RNase YbeY [Aeoliella mucimassa]QDU57986.1 Endoribonuclease YbeY [Aeoliella mucimassa]
MIDIAITNRQERLPIDADQLVEACRQIIVGDGREAASISLTVVDDEEMHALNREHLEHDYPTDVLSFPLSGPGEPLAGEVIVSTGTAVSNAEEYGNLPAEELLLYVVHGVLHLVGLGDKSEVDAKKMRQAEAYWLAELGVPRERIDRLVYVDHDSTDDPLVPNGEPAR